jgi:small subunit ribosomal protein S4
MGDIKKQKKKYDAPLHPWRKDRIESETAIVEEYGLKNKREIWRAGTVLSKIKSQVKTYSAASTTQLGKQRDQLIQRLRTMALLKDSGSLDDVLSLRVQDILDRRLQTFVTRKNMANSMKQARQFIVHGHITVAGKRVTVPSYMIKKQEEDRIGYKPGTTVQNGRQEKTAA